MTIATWSGYLPLSHVAPGLVRAVIFVSRHVGDHSIGRYHTQVHSRWSYGRLNLLVMVVNVSLNFMY
jgi:hypothetical protein